MKRLSLIAASIMLAASANAATVSGGSFSNPFATTEIDQFGSLTKFDGSLGHLDSITLTLTGAAKTTFTLTNNATQSQTAKFDATVDLFFGSTISSVAALIAAGIPTLTASTGFQTFAPGVETGFGPFTDSDSAIFNSALALILSDLTAPSAGQTFKVTCSSLSGDSSVGAGGNFTRVQATEAKCGASLEYSYTATPTNRTPEPGSLALVGLALAGIGFTARRKA